MVEVAKLLLHETLPARNNSIKLFLANMTMWILYTSQNKSKIVFHNKTGDKPPLVISILLYNINTYKPKE